MASKHENNTVLERQVAKLKPPPMYQVLLLNDDYTPMEFVVAIIQEYFNIKGVDHIGHSEGSDSLLMKPKLIQMDHVIQSVWNKVSRVPHSYLIYDDHITSFII